MAAIKAHIQTIYRVSVEIPNDLWEDIVRRGMEQVWDNIVMDATRGSVSAGSDRYSGVEEWAEFHSYDEALLCESRLIRAIWDMRARLRSDQGDES